MPDKRKNEDRKSDRTASATKCSGSGGFSGSYCDFLIIHRHFFRLAGLYGGP
jgi:hypothetical protein